MALGKNLKKSKKSSATTDEVELLSSSKKRPNEGNKTQIQSPFSDASAPKNEETVKSLSVSDEYHKQEELNIDQILLIVFEVGHEYYALSIDQVQEVVKLPLVAHVPYVEKYIKGVSNIRGNVYAIIDLVDRFGLDSNVPDDDSEHFALVVQSDDYKMAIRINGVPDTMIVNTKEIEDSSHLAKHGGKEDIYIKGVIKNERRLIIYIDILELIKADETS